ncbi:hypothetical protein [Flavivirga algicola]|uniref:HMA domain-containing protein n=1 Tax=Flavivirga algicola TaxID=2729136 RepID=A0ABX1RTE7_9FLAO|nr:hypothetical protein [Flavivirga algicola]NMH86270.1 hypothetical protein [Flavivirga algicola]
MHLLIFETNIKSEEKVKSIQSTFSKHNDILKWSIDLEDVDNVLKIEATDNITETDIINIVKTHGFYIEALAD